MADEYLDLYILGVAALTFTILGFTGVADVKVLSSITLALLAVLASSQIRTRRHVAEIARAQVSDPLAVLRTGFPDDLEKRRASASRLLLIGVSMTRTVHAESLTGLRQVLRSGGKVRVLVLDPTEDVLIRAALGRRPQGSVDWARRRIEFALEELANLRDSTRGDLEVRVTRVVPSMGVSAIDIGSPDGLIVLQHYEYKPAGEHAPILALRPSDGYWYEHFSAEAERMWTDGTPWPLSPAEALRRSARPMFKDEFGPELEQSMSTAREMLITGITRNTLLTSKYGKFEDWLRKGSSVRIMLMEPSCDAIAIAADRYYAERSPESTRHRIQQSLRHLAELKRSTGADLSVRLTTYPLAIGVIAVNAAPGTRSASTVLFAEYYTYQARGEPKFVLQPADGPWFDNLYQEAEALWARASDANLEIPS